MKMKFYDVKTRSSVEAEVTEEQEYKSRSLTRFVSKDVYDTLNV
jgi:hypothetical protein